MFVIKTNVRNNNGDNAICPMKKYDYEKSNGFLLIELLLIVAILGILAAVVLIAINPSLIFSDTKDAQTDQLIGNLADSIETCFTHREGNYASCDSYAELEAGDYIKNQNIWKDSHDNLLVISRSGQYLAVYGQLESDRTKCDVGSGTPYYSVYQGIDGTISVCCGSAPLPRVNLTQNVCGS